MYASTSWARIGSGKGLSTVWCQAINYANTDLVILDHREHISVELYLPLKKMPLKCRPQISAVSSRGPGVK